MLKTEEIANLYSEMKDDFNRKSYPVAICPVCKNVVPVSSMFRGICSFCEEEK